jgi:hypothetical protein
MGLLGGIRSRVRRRHGLLAVAGALVSGGILLSFGLLPAGVLPDPRSPRGAADRRVPLAVLGDSDSQAYHDSLAYPAGSGLRGGAFHAQTFQWTELLARLRGEELDLGDWGEYGGRLSVVRVLEALGFERRAPRKRDHEYNFAFAGAHCRDLNRGPLRQMPRLLSVMRHEPERWRRGVVVLRIGIVELGGSEVLERMARHPQAPELVALVDRCLGEIAQAVATLRREHAETALILVGILDNADHPPKLDLWRDPQQLANIRAVLDRFDEGLRSICARDPRATFFDDRAWFRARWGGRGPDGSPAYDEVKVGDHLVVAHRSGDDPGSSVLQDGHAGLVWNLLWTQSLSEHLTRVSPISPIADREVRAFLRDLLERDRVPR